MTYTAPLSELESCDVAVAGGGMAGVMAALAAARFGARTLLVEQHGFVGGQGTAGGVHTFCGETRVVNNAWREMLRGLKELGGLAEYRPNADGRAFEAEALKFVLQEMLLEAGVRLLLHTRLVDVERTDNRAVALVLHNKSGLQRLACSQVIDATGDADVVALGGWPYLKGGPAFKPGEELSLDEDSPPRQLPMSLYFTLIDMGHPVVPCLPPGCPTYKDDQDLPMTTVVEHGVRVTVKMKVIGFDATNGEELSRSEQEGRRQMMGVVHHLQTKGYRGQIYRRHALAWVFPHMGIREGRRVMGQYVMTAGDVLSGRHFPDAVAVGSYHTDYHWPNVVQRAGTGITSQCPPYQIPLRAMRPAGAANVLVPGRCMAGDQMAMSSFRVMGICAQTGFAAGTAAAMTGDLDGLDIGTLQSRLRENGVRLDAAPYYNYLRLRRGVKETVAEPRVAVGGVSLAVLPSGDVVVGWTERGDKGWAAKTAVRHEEHWLEPGTVCDALTEPAIELVGEQAERLRAEGIEEGELIVRETDGPARINLRLFQSNWTSRDGGQSWQPGETTSGSPSRSLRLISSPGDGDLQVRLDGDALLGSTDEGTSWPHRLRLDDRPAETPRPALVATADGLAMVYIDAAGTVVFRRVAPDLVTGGEEFPGDWHHSERTWVNLLEGHPLQPQRERTLPATQPSRPS